MKNQRQNLIMQIVKDENIGTQEELREALKRHGLKVTQARYCRAKQWYFRHNFRRRCVGGSCA